VNMGDETIVGKLLKPCWRREKLNPFNMLNPDMGGRVEIFGWPGLARAQHARTWRVRKAGVR
ncbi:hypothetical protein L195_g058936, partial [Trifolium pratense]